MDNIQSFKQFMTEEQYYHGTSNKFRKFRGPIAWVSKGKKFAQDYALESKKQRGGDSIILTVDVNIKNPLKFGKASMRSTVSSLLAEAQKQSMSVIRAMSSEEKKETLAMMTEVKNYYGATSREIYKYWDDPEYSEELKEIFKRLGFDSIQVKEDGYLTFGIFDPKDRIKIKSYDPALEFLKHDPTKLKARP